MKNKSLFQAAVNSLASATDKISNTFLTFTDKIADGSLKVMNKATGQNIYNGSLFENNSTAKRNNTVGFDILDVNENVFSLNTQQSSIQKQSNLDKLMGNIEKLTNTTISKRKTLRETREVERQIDLKSR